jgi:hypothetical protein
MAPLCISVADLRLPREGEIHTKDQRLFPIMSRHSVNQPDLLPEIMKNRVARESAIQDPGASRGSDGENGDGFPLLDREVDTGVV